MDKKNLIPDEDFDFEKEKYLEEKKAQEEYEENLLKRQEQEIEERKEHEKNLNESKVELIKLKQGVIDKSEVIHVEKEEEINLSFKEKLSNFWWHDKVWIIAAIFAIVVVGFIVYDSLSRTKPDLKILMTVNNGLVNRTEEVESFFEKYCDDINGDGEVAVEVISTPLVKDTDDYMSMQKYQETYLANMQTGEIIFVITDEETDVDIYSEDEDNNLLADVKKDFPDNNYVTKKGLQLRGSYIEDVFKYHTDMPQNVYLAMRSPTKTLKDSSDDMQKNYDEAFKIFTNVADTLKQEEDSGKSVTITTTTTAATTTTTTEG